MKKQAVKKTTKKAIKDEPEKKHIEEENIEDDADWTGEDKDPEFIDEDPIFSQDEDEDDEF